MVVAPVELLSVGWVFPLQPESIIPVRRIIIRKDRIFVIAIPPYF
jgi:hypothetical protein